MRTGLIAFGVIFLVLGGFMYFIPTQAAQATTTTVGAATADTRTSYASFTVPRPLAYATLLIGAILFVLGFALPNPTVINKKTPSQTHTVETTEHVEARKGRGQKVIRDRHEEEYDET